MNLRYNAGEVITAMVTPFNNKLEVDFDTAAKLANYLANNGSDAILVAGTTGECPTLTHNEELELLKVCKEAVADRAKIIMGTGSNSTLTAVEMTKMVEKVGVDAILTVVPYYNKPSQRGLIEHFGAIAKATSLPIILYNIPGRTGINMQPETIATVASKHENIVAVKQSNSDLDLVSEIISKVPEGFAVYSGDDSLTFPMLALGGVGVVSVASHLVGNEIKQMISEFNSGNIEKARDLHYKCLPIFKALFTSPNPTPLKAALSHWSFMCDAVRPPLVTLTDEEKASLFKVLGNYKKLSLN